MEATATLDISVFEALQKVFGLKLVKGEAVHSGGCHGSYGREADRIASG